MISLSKYLHSSFIRSIFPEVLRRHSSLLFMKCDCYCHEWIRYDLDPLDIWKIDENFITLTSIEWNYVVSLNLRNKSLRLKMSRFKLFDSKTSHWRWGPLKLYAMKVYSWENSPGLSDLKCAQHTVVDDRIWNFWFSVNCCCRCVGQIGFKQEWKV